MTPMEFILRFTFTNPDLDTTIVGTANPAHLRDNVEVLRKGPSAGGVYMPKPSAALPLPAPRHKGHSVQIGSAACSTRGPRPSQRLAIIAS